MSEQERDLPAISHPITTFWRLIVAEEHGEGVNAGSVGFAQDLMSKSYVGEEDIPISNS